MNANYDWKISLTARYAAYAVIRGIFMPVASYDGKQLSKVGL